MKNGGRVKYRLGGKVPIGVEGGEYIQSPDGTGGIAQGLLMHRVVWT